MRRTIRTVGATADNRSNFDNHRYPSGTTDAQAMDNNERAGFTADDLTAVAP